MLLNQNQSLQVIAFSTIGYLWAAQLQIPIIKIFIPIFFTANLFRASREKILSHAQFTIEAQSPQKKVGASHIYTTTTTTSILHRVCTLIHTASK